MSVSRVNCILNVSLRSSLYVLLRKCYPYLVKYLITKSTICYRLSRSDGIFGTQTNIQGSGSRTLKPVYNAMFGRYRYDFLRQSCA